MSLLHFAILLLPIVFAAPAKGVFPDQEKTHIFDNYHKFLNIQDHLDQLYYHATVKEDYYFLKSKDDIIDRTISQEIYQVKEKFSYDNALEVEDIDGFLNGMDSEYRRMQKAVNNMKKK